MDMADGDPAAPPATHDEPTAKPHNANADESKQQLSPGGRPPIWITKPHAEHNEERSVQSDSFSRQAEVNPNYSMTVVHSRRNANGTIGSVYSGNKIRHLKKEDGIPLWRKDIQYSFLRAVFEDQTRVFTLDSNGGANHTFAEIYINAMAKSSKTSKVLREKLLSDQEAAMNMAMICLLVNVGRMNTTLNCKLSKPMVPPTRADLDSSLPRNARPAPYLPSYPVFASASGRQLSVQGSAGRAAPQVHPQRLLRGH